MVSLFINSDDPTLEWLASLESKEMATREQNPYLGKKKEKRKENLINVG